jgi:N-methylhydantoinase A/oxoprolinase/acetone carboxylase beta subunit
MGIDVGGTFTKAVAIDNDTHEILGKSAILTTHSAPEGVARGVVLAFKTCLEENHIAAEDVIFLAHSTTQATNALLEGDVAAVGIIGLATGVFERFLAKRQTDIGDIPLITGRRIQTHHAFLPTTGLTRQRIEGAIRTLIAHGAKVIVASKAFGVDTTEEETLVQSVASEMQIPGTAAHEISKLYGLTVRTRSAVVNASILPKMMETANSTERSMRQAGIQAPLMIMRGDGGVMGIEEMRKRPVLTMLSGPTASIVGALMYLRASDGIYFEVGGTSTNIGVIKHGRPTIKYAEVGGHRTYVNSLDVRVLGVAGGSMVRVKDNRIIDMGPRSAHIAGLAYAAFTSPEEISNPAVEFFQPKAGDPADYVAIRTANGTRLAITNTCAANALGLVEQKYHAFGNRDSCRLALQPLADLLGVSVEDAARQILEKASEKLIPVVEELIAEYKLERSQVVLVGAGGGAAALLPFTAHTLQLEHQIPMNAEVISSIGVALAMVRDVVERVIPQPTSKEIAAIKREAKEAAIKAGANSESIEVFIEIDAQKQRVRAIALGAAELQTTDLLKECTKEEALAIAARSFNLPQDQLDLAMKTDSLYVYTHSPAKRRWWASGTGRPVRVIDKKGFIKVQRGNAIIKVSTVASAMKDLNTIWSDASSYKSESIAYPDIYLGIGGRVVDLSGMVDFESTRNVAHTELDGLQEGEPVIIIGAKNES